MEKSNDNTVSTSCEPVVVFHGNSGEVKGLNLPSILEEARVPKHA